jgi:hypothetical protein
MNAPRRSILVALSASALLACNQARPAPVNPVVGSESANVGLFTPGSTLGAATAAASADASAGTTMIVDPNGDRCGGSSGMAGTPCMLTITFQTAPLGQHWGPANIGAVWIEDASGTYIKTIERWAAVRARALYHWLSHACLTSWPEMDAVSTATLPNHNATHSDIWDGKDFKGKLVPDGMYNLFIEVTETETDFGAITMVPFTKGTSPMMVQPPDMTNFKGVSLAYMPTAGTPDMSPKDAGHGAADAGSQGADASVPNDAGTIQGSTGMGATSGSENTALDAGPASSL